MKYFVKKIPYFISYFITITMRKLYGQFTAIIFFVIFMFCSTQFSFAQADNCNAAVLLSVSNSANCTNAFTGTTLGATESQTSCVGNADDDVWFKFVATSTSHIVTVKGLTLYDPVVQIFSGICTSLVSIACVDATIASEEVAAANNLTMGATYFIRVYSYGGNSASGTFTICVTTADSPSPYCASNAFDPTRFINNFTTTLGISNINNPSGYSAAGYANNTAQSVVALPNSSVNFTATFTGGTFGFNIWVDWNNDNVFANSEKVFASGSYVPNSSGAITIPNGTLPGNYRMRIRATWYDINPPPCGTHDDGGETEDYTFTVQNVSCATIPTAVVASAITATSATLNWATPAPAPAAGYIYYYSATSTAPPFNSTGSGSTAAGVTNVTLSGLTSGATYYFWVRSNCGGTNNQGFWSAPIVFTMQLLIGNAEICVGESANLTVTGSCGGLTSSMTISGSWNTNPQAPRPFTMTNSNICNFISTTATYSTYLFQVSVTGTYAFLMADRTNYDGMAYIVSENFIPGQCSSGTWTVGDDDSSPIGNEPRLSATLTAGITYKLISTVWSSNNVTIVDTFQYSVTGPGSIQTGSTGVIQWYANATGGTPFGTGSPFNPVGVTGSPLANTNTDGTTTFYAACSLTPDKRTPATFTIKPKPTATISALGSLCNSDTQLSIVFTGNPPYDFTYTDNLGGPAITLIGISSSPYEISVSPSQQVIYTITNISNECGSGTATGSAEFKANTWIGLTDVWTSGSNWSKGSEPTDLDCVIIPANSIYPKITTANGFAKELLIKTNGRLDVVNENTITVSGKVAVQTNGDFIIANNSSLLQIDDIANLGEIKFTRITQPMYRYDYTYWNSPVTFDSNFSLSDLSPDTLWDKYWKWQPSINDGHGNWIQIPTSTIMNPTMGYIVRAPQTYSTSPTVKEVYTAVFEGIPNNGSISVPVTKGNMSGITDNDKWNLIGNPYPSAISVSAFTAANSTTVDGTLYFWTHNSAPSADNPQPFYGTAVYNYSDADYAMINNLTSTAATLGGIVPNGYIAAGSSFFLKCMVAGNVVFTNSMRVVGNNNQFFRTSSASQPSTSTENPLEKHLIRLNMLNNSSAFSQIVVGYADNATTNYDNGFDGTRFSSNGTSFYSVIENYDLGIQARPLPFASSDVVQLGYQTDLIDQFSIGIQELDPLFDNYNVLLSDKDLNISHDLKVAPYYFQTSAGRFDDRFELRYSVNLLATEEFQNNNQLTAYIKDNFLMSKSTQEISSAIIFDVSGKQIQTFEATPGLVENKWRFTFAQGIYFATFKMKDGSTITRKVINF